MECEWDLFAVARKISRCGVYAENVVSFILDAYNTKFLLQTQSMIYLGMVKPKRLCSGIQKRTNKITNT